MDFKKILTGLATPAIAYFSLMAIAVIAYTLQSPLSGEPSMQAQLLFWVWTALEYLPFLLILWATVRMGYDGVKKSGFGYQDVIAASASLSLFLAFLLTCVEMIFPMGEAHFDLAGSMLANFAITAMPILILSLFGAYVANKLSARLHAQNGGLKSNLKTQKPKLKARKR